MGASELFERARCTPSQLKARRIEIGLRVRMCPFLQTPQFCAHTLEEDTSLVNALTECSGQLVSGSWDSTIKVWDPATWTCENTLREHTRGVNALTVCSGRLVSGSGDSTIKVWDPATWTCENTLREHTRGVNA